MINLYLKFGKKIFKIYQVITILILTDPNP